ncbi:hypothetical protein D3C74_325820 [compost metagenome]
MTITLENCAIGMVHFSWFVMLPPAGIPPRGTVNCAVWKSPLSPPTFGPVCPFVTVAVFMPDQSLISPVSVVPYWNEMVAPAGMSVFDLLVKTTFGLIG